METHEILKKYFAQKKKFSPGYSLRSIARRLKVSPSFLSRVLSGERSIPYKMLLRLEKILDIAPEIFATLKAAHQVEVEGSLAPTRGKRKVETSLKDWEMASEESVRILREWFYLPILEASCLDGFDGKAATLARRLGLHETLARSACEELVALGLMTKNDKTYASANKKLRWDSAKSVNEVRRFHDQMLKRAQNELSRPQSEEDFKRRLITGITLSTYPEKIELAKKRLAECLHEIANDLIDDGPGTEVFHLAAQLFPLTFEK
jgi:uncharacterized protein (TIGR02147 family)